MQPEVPWSERFIDRTLAAPATLEGPIVVDGASDDAPLLRVQGMHTGFFAETPKELRTGSRLIARLSEEERLLAFSGDEVLMRRGSAIESLPARRRIASVDGDIVHARRTGPHSWLVVSRKGAELIAWSVRDETVQQLGRSAARRVAGVTAKAFIVIEERGTTDALLAVDFRSGASDTLLADAVIRRVAVAGDQVLVAAATATEPESLSLIPLASRERVRIGHWPGIDATAFTGITTRIIQWQSENATIEGLLVTPTSQKPRATLLFLHGGPEARAVADAHELQHPLGGYAAILARAGYAVLLPNFRNGKDLGNGRLFQTPAADALAGIQKLVDDGLADPERLGIYGFSYGAMLTAWIVARDHRFRAAAVSAGTLDLLTDDRT
ncbi:MAG TPA: prolyl oligopeptidase family serine peptidase, partial [Thermoanaerobaculia bacterium]|nr:prolyl oligopeptidase family serine peptidase [Thermoanaerobaculia bacterium]